LIDTEKTDGAFEKWKKNIFKSITQGDDFSP
jgi:hypothetical protein